MEKNTRQVIKVVLHLYQTYSKRGEKMPVRVNTKISDRSNEWLDRKAEEMALSKSALINLAIETYRTQVEVMDVMPQLRERLKQQGIEL